MRTLLTNRREFLLQAGGCGALAGLFVTLSGSESAGQSPKDVKPRVVVYMADKFSIEGFVKREKAEVEVDQYNGTPVTIPQGFFLVDDGPRRITFDTTLVDRVDPIKAYTEERIEHKKHYPTAGTSEGTDLPSLMEIGKTSPFDRNWTRTMQFSGKDKMGKNGTWEVTQHVGMLTPYSLRIDTTKYFNFSSAYLTREFSGEEILALLGAHPNYADDKALPSAERVKRAFKVAEFLAQAGFFDQAEQVLQFALKEFPKDKEAIEQRQRVVGEIHAREAWEETKRMALIGGQQQRVLKRIEMVPQKYASEDMLAKMRDLKSDYTAAESQVKQATKFLNRLHDEVVHPDRAIFRDGAEQIGGELCVDNVNRLETFLGQAAQYERLTKDCKKPELGPTELVSLAMSSWLLGSAAGETKPETAMRLWKTRQLILQYEKTDDMNLRQRMVEEATRAGEETKLVEEAAQIISSLPPTEPGEIDMKTQHVKAGKKTEYELQLPPEYRHGRHYPVLIVLHDSGETAHAMLTRWRNAAADNGYILAAPEWESSNSGYTYSEREHETVLDTIRDLRRRYHIDSDRVFLFGLRDGGLMALDVGMSHPDLFAGVSTMGAGPEKYSEVYWHNAQYLPLYIVNGDRVGTVLDKTHKLFENFVGKHFPSLWVQYKGRGAEWFGGEVPMIFEWMRVKRRAFPLTQVGRSGDSGLGTEFNTERSTDNSFYWLTTDEVQRTCWNGTGANFRIGATPAQLAATIYPDANEIRVMKAVGVSQVSVWLGRNLRGESMIDFTKPVSFRVNDEQVLNKKMVKLSLAVLLEDQYRRGDRQRVYMAKLDWPKARKEVRSLRRLRW